MTFKKTWVLASNNTGKLNEFAHLLQPFGITIQPQKEFGIKDAIENGLTFIENALIKARHASQQTGLPALADDSGLEVDALNGAPGIHSARYAAQGDQKPSDDENIDLLLNNMKAHPNRTAQFQCVLALIKHPLDPTPIIAQGTWHGTLLTQPIGTDGFGYDPIFWVESHQCSAAQLKHEVKNRISHRAQAVSQLKTQLRDRL